MVVSRRTLCYSVRLWAAAALVTVVFLLWGSIATVSKLATVEELTRTTIRQMSLPLIEDTMLSQNASEIRIPSDIPFTHYSPYYIFNCTNIHHISIYKKLGHGVSKQAFLGKYQGRNVVVKMVTPSVDDIKSCVKNAATGEARSRCVGFPNMKLMKEILLLQQLRHPNLLDLLGFCVRSEETESESLLDHGVVAVYEFGEKVTTRGMRTWSFSQALDISIDLVDFVSYMENSPLGSLRISDFKTDHFLMVGNKIKYIDLDDINNLEPQCDDRVVKSACSFHLPCVNGFCRGHNAKINLDSIGKRFLQHILIPKRLDENPRIKGSPQSADVVKQLTNTLASVQAQLKDVTHVNGSSIRQVLFDIRKTISFL